MQERRPQATRPLNERTNEQMDHQQQQKMNSIQNKDWIMTISMNRRYSTMNANIIASVIVISYCQKQKQQPQQT
jgi:hypothetical protein